VEPAFYFYFDRAVTAITWASY